MTKKLSHKQKRVTVAEWLVHPPAKQEVCGSNPASWGKQPAVMLAIYTSRDVAPEVNLRECISHMPLQSLNKAAHSDFETQGRHHQKPKTGVSVAPKMDMCPTKNLKKYLLTSQMWVVFLQDVGSSDKGTLNQWL